MEITPEMLSSPKEVARLLQEYQDWRKGVGKYAWNPDPEKNESIPFTPQQLTQIEEAAIDFLSKLA